MNWMNPFRSALALLLVISLAGCGASVNLTSNTLPQAPHGAVFLLGSDAPLGSVLAFKIMLSGLTASDGVNTVSLTTASQDVEFSRLNGLHDLLELQSIPAGNYTTVTATLASPLISYLDTTTSPPSIKTLSGTLTQSTVTVTLPQPMVVTANGLVGLLMDFRLRDSLPLDATGQITGMVDPHMSFRAVSSGTVDADVDDLRGAVLSVNAAAGSFVMQGPHGRQITVQTDAQTDFENGESLSTLTTNSIVEVSGSLQVATLNLLATDVEVLTTDHFILGGLITDVRPATGAATQIDLLVRTELPSLTGVQIGQITTLNFDGNEHFLIHQLRLPIGVLLFNQAALVPGQRITAGGALISTTSPPGLDVRRVVLHPQGLEGTWIPGSTNVSGGNNGSFNFMAAGLQGNVIGMSVKVLTSNQTRFINLSGLSALTGTASIRIRVVGLVLKDQVTGNAVIIARAVEKF